MSFKKINGKSTMTHRIVSVCTGAGAETVEIPSLGAPSSYVDVAGAPPTCCPCGSGLLPQVLLYIWKELRVDKESAFFPFYLRQSKQVKV